MKWVKGIVIVSMTVIVFMLFAQPSISQEKLVMVGIVKRVERKMVMDVENEKDQSLISFRIGRKTVYHPRRYPVPGEKVKVEYLPHRGSFVAFTVTILEVEETKESSK